MYFFVCHQNLYFFIMNNVYEIQDAAGRWARIGLRATNPRRHVNNQVLVCMCSSAYKANTRFPITGVQITDISDGHDEIRLLELCTMCLLTWYTDFWGLLVQQWNLAWDLVDMACCPVGRGHVPINIWGHGPYPLGSRPCQIRLYAMTSST